MSAADKTKLDGIAEGANNYTYTLPTASSTLGGVKTTSTVTSTSGLTACPIIGGVPYYKDTNTTYTLPNATSSTLGGVKIGNNITVSSGTISLTKDNVTTALGYTPPTTDTTYSVATTSANGLMSSTDKSKLDGIATGATKNTASSTTPKANGTAAVGSESNYARGDHVHPLQTTVSGNAGTATKLATARNIGKASFDGSGNIFLSSIMGRATLSGSGTSNKTKWTKFATVDVSDSAWSGCHGLLHFMDAEAAIPVGLLNFHIRSGSDITTASVKLRWLTLVSTGHAKSVIVVKVEDGIYDLYFSPQDDYISAKVTLIDCYEPSKITLHSSQGYVASVTAFATSALEGCVYAANVLTNTRNIKLTGDATGTATFNGSADASIATTLANSGVTAGSYGPTANVTGTNGTTINVPQITVDAKGRVTSVVNRVYTSKDTDTNTTYSAATQSAAGLMSADDKKKLDGVAASANNYSLPAATTSARGGVIIGSNITVSSGTISLTKDNVTAALGYTPPTTNTTYSNMTAATSSAAGKAGLVPAPAAGKQASFLRGDGTWVVPTNTTYSAATTSAAGLMSAADKTKLDGIATSANNYSLPNATSSVLGGVKIGSNITVSSGTISLTKSNVTTALGYTPPTTNTTYSVVSTSADGLCPKRGGTTTKFLRDDGTWATPPDTNTTYSAATTSANGLMSSSDKTKLNGIATGAQVNNVVVSTSQPSSGDVWINPNGQMTNSLSPHIGKHIRVGQSSATSIANKTTVTIGFQTTILNTAGSLLSLSSNGIKIGAGVSKVIVNARWTCWGSFARYAYIYVNGNQHTFHMNQTGSTTQDTAFLDVVEGDVIYFKCYQESGSTQTTATSQHQTFMDVMIIG